MRSYFTLILASAVVLIVAVFMLTFTVRFTEVGVVTTFGKADADSIVTTSGLKIRWPYPIQNVTLYDTRSRFIRAQNEQQQTADRRQVIVQSFLLWRVSDPLKFYQRFSGESAEAREHYRVADNLLRSLLRASMSEIGAYRIDELFTPEPGASKLPELEQAILDRLTATSGRDVGGASLDDYGVEVALVGITRITFPEEATKDVFERMKATRQRIASEAVSEGAAQAFKIQTDADSDAGIIREFARTRADEIRSEGDLESAQYLKALAVDQELAVFIENIRFMKNLFAKRTTLVLPTSTPGMKIFDPEAMQSLGSGEIPSMHTDAKAQEDR